MRSLLSVSLLVARARLPALSRASRCAAAHAASCRGASRLLMSRGSRRSRSARSPCRAAQPVPFFSPPRWLLLRRHTASCLLVRRRSSPPAARSPWCSCPIPSAASALSPCPSSPIALQCRIALRLWLSALVQSSWLASRALLVLSRSRLCPLWSPRGGSVACASSLAGAGALVFCGLRCGCLGTFRFNFRANPQACGPLSDGLQPEAPSRTPAGVPRTRSYAGKLRPP